MRGAICYYSATGNTRLACEALAGRLGVPFDLVDVVARPRVALDAYDVIGLACSTDFWSVPQAFGEFVRSLPPQAGKPAWVLNTFGGFSGRTLLALRDMAEAKGFSVLGGHSLHMPESYPPLVAVGLASSDAPRPGDVADFEAFAAALAERLAAVSQGRVPDPIPLAVGLGDRAIPALPRATARLMMGAKRVDEEACRGCGACERRCPYGAIRLDPKPVFDEEACFGCWRCFNRCPQRAIRVRTYPGKAFYAGPSDRLRGTLAEAPYAGDSTISARRS